MEERPSWDKSIIPNITTWRRSVELGYIPKERAKEFIEKGIEDYLKRKRISKKKLTNLYNNLPSFISEELKEEVRERAGIEEEFKIEKPKRRSQMTIDEFL